LNNNIPDFFASALAGRGQPERPALDRRIHLSTDRPFYQSRRNVYRKRSFSTEKKKKESLTALFFPQLSAIF
jgi:hypothetical protein